MENRDKLSLSFVEIDFVQSVLKHAIITVRRLEPEIALMLHQPVVGGLQAALDDVSAHLQDLPSVHGFEQVEQQQHAVLGDLQHGIVVDIQGALHPTPQNLVEHYDERVGDPDVALAQR